jgi:peptidoglycan/LPS O-acetylase OafA/YrhL
MVSTVWLVLNGNVPGVWRFTIFQYVPCFLGGVAAYAILVRVPKVRVSSSLWMPLIAVSLIACFMLWPSSVGGWVMCLALGLALPFVRQFDDSWLTRAAKRVAQYSYGIYLLHVPLLRLALNLLPEASARAQLALAAGLVAAGSFAGYHLIEHPMIQVGRRAALRIGQLDAYPSGSALGAPQMPQIESYDPLGK